MRNFSLIFFAWLAEVASWTANAATSPAIWGSPSPKATVGTAYLFKPGASDPDGDTLAFAIGNKPAWASFDTRTGRLSGTPGTAHAKTYADIKVSVTDGKLWRTLPLFSITVRTTATNQAPAISGTPATIASVGAAYAFQPTASDPEGKTLSFTVTNKPAWAAFNAQTGRLSGTPVSSHIATYSAIQIKASDGVLTTSLPAFSIAVTAQAPASSRAATLSWQPPTTNTNGTPLVNLGGYRIYYGTSAAALNSSITLTNASLTVYMIENLSPGTWYFAIAARNLLGVEGPRSAVVAKTIS